MPHHLVYGSIPHALSNVPPGARQVSPLMPGGQRLEEIAPASATSILLVAPPGTTERRYTLALALNALQNNGELIALAPKDKGGARLKRERSKGAGRNQISCEINQNNVWSVLPRSARQMPETDIMARSARGG